MTIPVHPQSLMTFTSEGMQRAKPKISAFSPSAAMSEIAALSGAGHARFDAVDAQRVQLLGDRHLLLAAEDDGGLLLAVTQGDVVNLDVLGPVVVLCRFRQVVPGADEPLVGFPGFLHVASEELLMNRK